MSLINETKAWIVDLYKGKDRQSLWVKVSGGFLDVVTNDTIETVKTTLTTTPTKINTPTDATNFFMLHKTDNSIAHIGNSNVDVSGDFIEMEVGDVLQIDDYKNENDNEIYGVVASGTLDVFVTAGVNS